ncbi:response regulator, partial [Thermodesulfobacteriota bacterium]
LYKSHAPRGSDEIFTRISGRLKGVIMKTILLVDDDESIQLLYREEFKEAGFKVVSVYNGSEALNIFKEVSPDLVILDIQMPGLNGIEVLRQIKMVDSSMPVILNSAYQEFKQDLGAWASDEYVVKSSDIGELMAAVQKHIG